MHVEAMGSVVGGWESEVAGLVYTTSATSSWTARPCDGPLRCPGPLFLLASGPNSGTRQSGVSAART